MSVVKYPAQGTQTNVHFTYPKTDVVKLMMETCQNMVKLKYKENGEVLVNEYAMDEDTPTALMKQRLIDTAFADIINSINKLTDSNFDTQKKLSLSAEGNDFIIPIKYVSTYKSAHLDYMDKAILDMIVSGALVQWFNSVSAADLKAIAQSDYDVAKSILNGSIMALYRKITFNNISNFSL